MTLAIVMLGRHPQRHGFAAEGLLSSSRRRIRGASHGPLDDLRRVVEQDRSVQRARREERAARSEQYGDQIDDDLIDEAEPQCLASDLAPGHVDDPVARAGVVLGGTGLPFQPFVRSNSRQPMTTQATSR